MSFRSFPVGHVSYGDLQVKNPGTHQRVVDCWDAYVRLFAGATSEIAIGEASRSYLWDRQSLRLIRERLPNAKIIIVLVTRWIEPIRIIWPMSGSVGRGRPF